MKRLLLKEYRVKAKMLQFDVAKALNITQSMYSRLELGKSLPDSNQIMILSELFDCTPNDLFGIKTIHAAIVDPLFEEYKEFVNKLKK